jgi:DNA-binding MarR family transcriptional regulator
MEAFRAIRRTMPLQHAYAFLFVALEEGCSVSEYAKRAGTTQAVMTRILFALSSRNRGRGCRLVQQVIDPQDGRRTQTFLTVRGKALAHEIVRLIKSDRPRAMQLRKSMMTEKSPQDLERDQWLSKLIAAGLKLGADDIQLAIRQVDALIGHRQSKRSPRLHGTSRSPKLFSGRVRR